MEVHHHSYTANPVVNLGRKKWTHYFWEFLMLSLAVTAGFFVENQREHIVEHRRSKEFAKLLTEDLSFDIAELERADRILNKIIESGDSLASLLNDQERNKVPGANCIFMNTDRAGAGASFQVTPLYSS